MTPCKTGPSSSLWNCRRRSERKRHGVRTQADRVATGGAQEGARDLCRAAMAPGRVRAFSRAVWGLGHCYAEKLSFRAANLRQMTDVQALLRTVTACLSSQTQILERLERTTPGAA